MPERRGALFASSRYHYRSPRQRQIAQTLVRCLLCQEPMNFGSIPQHLRTAHSGLTPRERSDLLWRLKPKI